MKKLTLSILFIGLLLPNLWAQKMNKAQKAVKAAIENETAYFNARDYDKWAASWIHSPEIYWAVTGPEMHWECIGWDELNKWAMEDLKENPEKRPTNQVKTDYQIRVLGDMAYANFLEDGNRTARVLQKEGDQWKLLSMTITQNTAYKKKAQDDMLKSMMGKWEVVPASIKLTGTESHIKYGNFEFASSDNGLSIKGDMLWKNKEGKTQNIKTMDQVSMDTEHQKMIAFNSVHGSGTDAQPWTVVNMGDVKVMDDLSMVFKMDRAGDEKAGYKRYYKMNDDGTLYMKQKFWNSEGKETWSMAYNMKRVALVGQNSVGMSP